MPELPEVETVARGLRAPLVGKRIKAMWHDWERALHSPGAAEFAARISGQKIRAVNRRGKYILIALDAGDTLLIHLKMSGRLYVAPAAEEHEADRWVHVRFDLDSGEQLRFSDLRKFGRVYLSNDVAALLAHLGPEPLSADFTLARFQSGMRGRSRAIKSLLLQQEFVAGIGNIYADEALFRAGINPAARANSLSEEDCALLHRAIQDALRAGIAHEGASIGWYRKPDGKRGNSQNYFYVYGREGLPCRHCGSAINKIRLAQRGTHFCPQCQPAQAAD